ncbi:MAG: M28 family peptidase [Clostridia bacterium]|nr:M28 family peptidase [Clostridia bacterium]
MTETTKEIFEKYEVRKTKEQKAAFRDYLTSVAKDKGYKVVTEESGKSVKNVIVGDPGSAEVIYTAHYDTCAVMPLPNFISPKCLPLYILYQLVLSLIIYIIPFSIMLSANPILEATGSKALFALALYGGYALLLGMTYLVINGPANKHTANDNTSGVTLLIDIMSELPEELKSKVAFIFFDLEERGTVGSKCYKKLHPRVAKEKLILNFDCVSDGKNILFVPKKGAYDKEGAIAEAFTPTGEYTDSYSVEVARKAFYPSDQRNFERGVGVSALNKSKSGILYMDKIHTKRDTVYDEENIAFLKTGAIRLAEMLAKEKVEL